MITCQNCSYQTEKDISFCPNCGNPVKDAAPANNIQDNPASTEERVEVDNQAAAAPQSITSTRMSKLKQVFSRKVKQSENLAEDTPRKLSRRAKISIIITSCLVVLGIAAWTGYKIYLNNNPKIVYLLAESATQKAHQEKASDFYAQDSEFWQAIFTDSSSFSADIRSKVDMDLGMEHDLIDLIESLDILSNITVSLQGGRDAKENWSELSMELREGRKSFVDMTFQQDQDQYYIASDTLMDSALQWEQDDNSIFGMESNQNDDLLEALKLTDKEKETLQKWMKNYIQSKLTNHVFDVDKNAKYDSPDGSVNMKKITLTLDEPTLSNMLVSLVDDVRTDEVLLQMIVDRAETIFEITKPEESDTEMDDVRASYRGFTTPGVPTLLYYVLVYQQDLAVYLALKNAQDNVILQDDSLQAFANEDGDFNRAAFEDALQSMLYELRMYFLNEFAGELYVEAYINKNNVIAHRFVELIISDNEDRRESLKVDWTQSYWKDKKSVVHTADELNLNIRDYDELLTLTTYRNYTLEKAGDRGLIEGEAGFSAQENRHRVFDISADYSIDEALGNTGTSQYDIELSILNEGERVRFDIQAEREKNIKRNTFEQQINVQTDFKVPLLMDRSASITINTTVDLTLDKGTPPVKSSFGRRATLWKDLSEDERDEFLYEMSDRLYRQFSSVFLNVPF